MEVIRNLLPTPRLDPALVEQMEALFRQHSRGLDPAPGDVVAARTRFLNSMRAEMSLNAASAPVQASGPIHPRLALPRILQSSVRPAVATGAIVLFASTGVAHAAGLDPLNQVAKFVQAPVELMMSGIGLGDTNDSNSGPRNGNANAGGENSSGSNSGSQNSDGPNGAGGPPDGGRGNAPAAAPGAPNVDDASAPSDVKPGPNGNPQGAAVGFDGNTDDAPGQTGETPPQNVPRSESAHPRERADREPAGGVGSPVGETEPIPAAITGDETSGSEGAGEGSTTGEPADPGSGGGAESTGSPPGEPSGPPTGNPGNGPEQVPETPPGLEENSGQGSENAPDTPPGLQTVGDGGEDDEGVTAPPSTPSPDPSSITPGRQGQGNANGLEPGNPGQGHSDMPPSGNSGNGNGNSGNGNSGTGRP